jgi:hypothetical protein
MKIRPVIDGIFQDRAIFILFLAIILGVVCFFRFWWLYQPANVESIKNSSMNACVKEGVKYGLERPRLLGSDYSEAILANHAKNYWTNDGLNALKGICEDQELARKQQDAVTP